MLKKILSGIILFVIVCFLGLFSYLIITGSIKTKTSDNSKPIENKPKAIGNGGGTENSKIGEDTTPEGEKTKTNESSNNLVNLKTNENQKSIQSNAKIKSLTKTFKIKKTLLNQKNNFLSKKLLEQALKTLNIKNWRAAVNLSYTKSKQTSVTSEPNKYKISHFAFEPDVFQKIVLEEIAQKINFANLIIVFEYYQNFQQVKIKIAFESEPTDFIEKYYQLTKN